MLALSRSNSRSISSSSVSLEKLSSPNGFQPDMSGGLAGDVTPSEASRGFLPWRQASGCEWASPASTRIHLFQVVTLRLQTRDPQAKALPPGQAPPLQWAWWRYRNPAGSGTQEGRTCRGQAAAAGQTPAGTGAAVGGGREGEEGEGMRDGPSVSW